jgi:hypothetical protein
MINKSLNNIFLKVVNQILKVFLIQSWAVVYNKITKITMSPSVGGAGMTRSSTAMTAAATRGEACPTALAKP